jgi:hypothetical protein
MPMTARIAALMAVGVPLMALVMLVVIHIYVRL